MSTELEPVLTLYGTGHKEHTRSHRPPGAMLNHTNAKAVFARISNTSFIHMNAETVFAPNDSPMFTHMNTACVKMLKYVSTHWRLVYVNRAWSLEPNKRAPATLQSAGAKFASRNSPRQWKRDEAPLQSRRPRGATTKTTTLRKAVFQAARGQSKSFLRRERFLSLARGDQQKRGSAPCALALFPRSCLRLGGPAAKAFGSLTSANDPHPTTHQNKTDQTKETLNVPVRAAVRRHLLC